MSNHNQKQKIKIGVLSIMGMVFLPVFVLAAPKSFSQFTDQILLWIDFAIPITLSLAVLFFFKNIFISVIQPDNKEQLTKLKKNTLWGIATIFLMVSIWGVVALLRNTFLTTDSGFGGRGGSSLPTGDDFDLSR